MRNFGLLDRISAGFGALESYSPIACVRRIRKRYRDSAEIVRYVTNNNIQNSQPECGFMFTWYA
jgi:hypothetical protein